MRLRARHSRHRVHLRAAAIAGTAFFTPSHGTPDTPAQSGRILFESDRVGQRDLWVMDTDGTRQANIADDKIDDSFPRWSPDGLQIVWTRGAGPESEIWIMKSDGTDRRQLTHNTVRDLTPDMSPDGTRIAFTRGQSGNVDVRVMNADGTGELRLTTDPAFEAGPRWSPDGEWLALDVSRLVGNHLSKGDVWILRLADLSVTQLTSAPGADDVHPHWAP